MCLEVACSLSNSLAVRQTNRVTEAGQAIGGLEQELVIGKKFKALFIRFSFFFLFPVC